MTRCQIWATKNKHFHNQSVCSHRFWPHLFFCDGSYFFVTALILLTDRCFHLTSGEKNTECLKRKN